MPKPINPRAKGSLNLPESKLPMKGEPKYGDFRDSMHWRIFRILSEFIEGFQYIADFKKSVTVFGSARCTVGDKWYEEAYKLGKMLAEAGYTIVTGGGPGAMEAANGGAVEVGGSSVGLNIQLPTEQRLNPFVNRAIGFHYFFTRKLMLTYSAEAYVYFPGGFGTLDEFLEITTLIQTKKISTHIPVILVSSEYWRPLLDWVRNDVYGKYKAIDKEDMEIYDLVDSAEEAFKIIKKRARPRNEF